jgi:hypothetical protein
MNLSNNEGRQRNEELTSNLSSHRANIYSGRKANGESYLSDAIKTTLLTEEG